MRGCNKQVLFVKSVASVIGGILLLTVLSACLGESQPSSQRVLNVGMILGSGGLGVQAVCPDGRDGSRSKSPG